MMIEAQDLKFGTFSLRFISSLSEEAWKSGWRRLWATVCVCGWVRIPDHFNIKWTVFKIIILHNIHPCANWRENFQAKTAPRPFFLEIFKGSTSNSRTFQRFVEAQKWQQIWKSKYSQVGKLVSYMWSSGSICGGYLLTVRRSTCESPLS